MKLHHKKLILASKSPRRSQLLEQADIPFEIRTREVEEIYPPEMHPDDVPEYLAGIKAEALADTLKEDEIILAADCVVIHENVIFGKPKNYEEALRTLRLLSGKSHRVITGICLMSKEKTKTFSATSTVYVAPLSEEEIKFYIDKYQPFDKAGSYAIQEWIGLCKIEKIEGSFFNIVGLPVHLVYKELKRF